MRWFALVAALLLAQLGSAHAQFVQQVKLTSAGTSQLVFGGSLNHAFTPAGVGVYVTINGTATCTVQISPDPLPVWPPVPTLILPDWNNHDVLVNITTSSQSNIAFPFTAMRLVCNPLTGTAILSLVGY